MSSASPTAFLALWNGIDDPALQAEYETWHAVEHVPERVGCPGFVSAARWLRLPDQPGPDYFTLYWLDGLQALATPRYRELLDAPTAWSARMRQVLTQFCREPCAVQGAHGFSQGGCLATLQVRTHTAPALDATLARLVADGLALQATWGLADLRNGHPLATAAGQASGTGPGQDAVILLQHLHAQGLQQAVCALCDTASEAFALRSPPAAYQLQSTVRQADLPHPLSQRQPPRPALARHFHPGDTQP